MDTINTHACLEGFEQQRKAGIHVDWFTWQIAWHDAMFTKVDTAPPTASTESLACNPVDRTAPFSNCQFHECDLPGQCRSEGKCHHPVKQAASGRKLTQDQIEAISIAIDWAPYGSQCRKVLLNLLRTASDGG